MAPGEPPPFSPRSRFFPLLCVLGVVALGAAYGHLLARLGATCSFRTLTGAPCPGCGLTRACLALLGGDVAEAFRLHPLSIPAAVLAAAAGALGVAEAATGRPWLREAARRRGLALAVAGIVLLAAVWAARVVLRPEWSPDPIPRESPAGRLLGR